MAKNLLLINGPNLNLLGTREPDVYGTQTLADIEALCAARLREQGIEAITRQSNHEGALVDAVQEAGREGCGIIINAGAYSHTSIALLDAVQAVDVPVIEVHLSNIFKRDEFRHHSYVSLGADGVICGLGATGYICAADALANMLGR